MQIKRLKVESGIPAGEVLQRIYDARSEGVSVAVPVVNLGFMHSNSLCQPIACGELEGYYLFRERFAGSPRYMVQERLLALVLIFFLLPLYLLTALAVLMFDGPPVFFNQLRFGLNNCGFKIFKFRTMVAQSEELHPRMQRRWEKKGQLFKMNKDPRVTPLGGFLRRTFLDELPQLFNVLKGDMRLIGARPLPASDNHHYKMECHRLRMRGMPGITGLWQVSGRNELTFDQMCLLDYYYDCNRSWKLDLMIVLKTVQLLLCA